jgi:DNA polymerase III epsilon subunit-like protein
MSEKFAQAVAGLERVRKAQTYCTMKETTNICKLPGNYGKFKWPKLTEAHQHFFGIPVEGAHDAMTDVRACKRIFFEIKKHEASDPIGL